MANKCLKMCSISHTIRAVQIRIAMSYDYTLVRMTKIQITDTRADKEAEQQRSSFVAEGSIVVWSPWKVIWVVVL